MFCNKKNEAVNKSTSFYKKEMKMKILWMIYNKNINQIINDKMFKYFALAFDFFLAITYSLSNDQIVYFVFVPPILHTLAFLISPHCYTDHCWNVTRRFAVKNAKN